MHTLIIKTRRKITVIISCIVCNKIQSGLQWFYVFVRKNALPKVSPVTRSESGMLIFRYGGTCRVLTCKQQTLASPAGKGGGGLCAYPFQIFFNISLMRHSELLRRNFTQFLVKHIELWGGEYHSGGGTH